MKVSRFLGRGIDKILRVPEQILEALLGKMLLYTIIVALVAYILMGGGGFTRPSSDNTPAPSDIMETLKPNVRSPLINVPGGYRFITPSKKK